MNSLALLGLQWGDEGKGKMVDVIAARFDLAVRYQGGPNAGHTVCVDGVKWVFHQLPAGILNPKIHVAIAAGCVLHPQTLFDEWKKLEDAGVDYQSRITIDPRTHIILPHHRLLDKFSDEERGEYRLGTTHRGIGPCYQDKYARIGIRVADLYSPQLSDKLVIVVKRHNAVIQKLYGGAGIGFDETISELKQLAERIKPYVGDVAALVNSYLETGKRVLYEAAQGVMLDLDHGSYPYVTSSNPGTLSIPVGIGISYRSIAKVVGLTKAYATRVGAGPFPTEDEGEVGYRLQKIGNEFGAATGRRRRCGWLDLPLLRYAVKLNAVDGLAIAKLDVLDSFDKIKVCTGYRQSDGAILSEVAPHNEAPGEPVYQELEGWMTATSHARVFDELPEKARSYLKWISDELALPLWLVSVGQERSATITLPDFPF